jgi:F0F1-type ATP synthase assembly protein I
MKLLPSPASARRSIRADDTVGRGMDAAFTMLLFVGIGFAVDRWLGTTPVLMIALSVLAAVGLFYSWKARYMTKMEELEARRRQDAAP